jgi:NAD(P)-dependent dehydrogenase (short-subunit alcohol dehydrogenase family)
MPGDPAGPATGPGALLAGRFALVTGASSGIGRAVALALGDAGARVVAVGRDRGRLQELADVADAGGSSLDPVACDLTRDTDIRMLAARVAEATSALDILVSCAGAIDFGTVEDAPIEQLDRLVRTNLRAPYLLTQTLLPLLRQARGHVIFVNSSAGVRPSAGAAAYGATKHALRGLADALRDEVNPSGVRVTSLYPGRTRTPLQAAVYRWEGRDGPLDDLLEPADVASVVIAVIALPPTAEVTDLHIRPAVPPDLRGKRAGGSPGSS